MPVPSPLKTYPEPHEDVRKKLILAGAPHGTNGLKAEVENLGYEVCEKALQKDLTGFSAAIVHVDADPNLDYVRHVAQTMPVILLCHEPRFELQLAAARAGVKAVLWEPFDTVEIGAWLSSFDEMQAGPLSVLIVDDDELAAEAYAMSLARTGIKTRIETQPQQTIDAISAFNPDLVVLDMHMPDVDGIEVAHIIRQSRKNLSLPIVFLSAEQDEELQVQARQIGGDEFLTKPISLDLFAARVKIRAERAVALRQVMERDSLTGLLDHAHFKERLRAEIARGQRTGLGICVALIDLDHFKKVNDTYGHQAGDRVIQALSYALSAGLRSTDLIARYGGEEFGVILLDTSPEHASKVINKIRESFGQLVFDADGAAFSVTLSAGISGTDTCSEMEQMVGAADSALYEAKRAGRNTVRVADSSLAESNS